MAPPEPEVFDVFIFGASGFTGKYVIREALKFLSPSSPLRSLAVAGRSRDRVAAAFRWAAAPAPPPEGVAILVADAADPASLAALASRARVVLSCAGPFRLHGHAFAAACAAAGADCLDISGEPEFMERVEAELHEPAAKSGSLIVSACGFDSVPAELGFLFHSRQWEPPSAPVTVEAYVSLQSTKRIVGNIGTYESAVLGVANAGQLQALRRSRPRRPRPNASCYFRIAASGFFEVFDQIPGPPPPKGSLIEGHNPLGMWAMKLPSADTVGVKRTLSTVTEHPEGLPGAEETPEYAEHRKSFWSLLLKYPEFFSAGMFSRARPTEEEVKSASFKMWFVGHGYSDTAQASERGSKPDKEVITKVSGPEVGYITTPIVLVQCALVLLSQRGNLPKGGVYTPGAVFGPTDLQQRLQENGMPFDVQVTRSMR
ncbi:putative mitochondrial saccharopine dehydrogenase-like oxidoreductase [Panicum miliaceum]|uniref:Mitochondrial saccharopine dehydrogenase-like oxidoreductase n=1 Tax=Panicum miliaceum TaxID=4540 RepID=A0A3L6QKM5_PANMI|nr:putative mitochondrial saccharopine dehydrogenase-like oxidoreductase [Panicum miliaceum]